MDRIRLLFLVLFLGGVTALGAQAITGTVVDAEGTPLIGASVLVDGTTIGTVTDIDGNFSLSIPAAATELVVSYTGFTTKNIVLTGASNYEITMDDAAALLGEVVVTGYGTQTRRRLTTSVASVSGEELAGQPVTSFTDALQGRLPGVNISTNAGTLGAQSSILVRGIGSINGDTQTALRN